MKDVGIWIRVSTEDQAKGESPEHHERRARLYAEAKGWNVIEVYHMEGVSGKSVMEHPTTKKMLQDIKHNRITGLIFSKLARLARNTRELLDFADIFRDCDADLISLQESIDTSTPAGRLFYTVVAATTQFEREEIASRVAASVPIRAQLGKPLGGAASYGYKWQGKELVIDEKEAPIRKLLHDTFIKLKRKKATASALNEKGYRTRNGARFSGTTIGRLLRDSTAKGERIANYTKSLGDGKKWVLKPEKEWIRTTCPAIVSEEVWTECVRILDEQENKRTSVGPRPTYLLAGFMMCHCGTKMYVHNKNSTYRCRGCNNKILVSDIDEIYHEQLKSFLLTETDIDQYLISSNTLIQEKENLLSILSKDAVSLKKKADELVEMRVNGEIPSDSFTRHYHPIDEQLKQIELQLPELQAEIDFLKIQTLSSETVLNEAKDLYEKWPSLPIDDKRNIVEVITDGITIYKEDISIKLSYLPFQNGGKREHNLRDSYSPQA